MKTKSIIIFRLVFFLFVLSYIVGCTNANAQTQIPTVNLNNYVVGTWLDTWAVSHTTVIEKINGAYRITYKFDDSSSETITPTVKVVNGEERLYYDDYGDWMVIQADGTLSVYDGEGLIYSIQPK